MKSIFEKTGSAWLIPPYTNRGLLYMYKTSIQRPSLPAPWRVYWMAIKECLKPFVGAKSDICYITIDEKKCEGDTHRRGGIHVDFNWYEELASHVGDEPTAPGFRPPNPTYQGKHNHKAPFGNGHPRPHVVHDWNHAETHGGMLLASNKIGCKAYLGKFTGTIGEGGDCSSIDVSGLESKVMAPNEVYYLNALCIHEPLVISGERCLIRINFHPEFVKN